MGLENLRLRYGVSSHGNLTRKTNRIHSEGRGQNEHDCSLATCSRSSYSHNLGQHMKPGDRFQDFHGGPMMVVVPAGEYLMGSGKGYAAPIHKVTFDHPFAVGIYAVTFDQWDTCFDAGGTSYKPSETPKNPKVEGGIWTRGARPVINVDWNDARSYAMWLRERTGKQYRLLTEAEWEYCARAGSTTRYCFGDEIARRNLVVCKGGLDVNPTSTVDVGTFTANAFGLHEVHGNVWEWVEDSSNGLNYSGAPVDGSAWTRSEQAFRMMRGGSWDDIPDHVTSATRKMSTSGFRFNGGTLGFRVARTLTPDEMEIGVAQLMRPLEQCDLPFTRGLTTLQAGILEPQHKPFVAIVSGSFRRIDLMREKLAEFARLASGCLVHDKHIARAFRKEESERMRTIHLSAAGLRKLGVSAEGWSEEFWKGMSASSAGLGDPQEVTLLGRTEPTETDLLLVLAAPTKAELSNELDVVSNWASEFCDLTCFEYGSRRFTSDGRDLGPLGFADGLSQPRFIRRETDARLNSAVFNPLRPPSDVLVSDPLCTGGGVGSYLVLRKYEVDEAAFNAAVADLVTQLGGGRTDEEVAAMFFGRFRDGTPLAALRRASARL